jgi:hypothetical protein
MQIRRALRAVLQLLWPVKGREVWFSLGENHEKAYRFGRRQLRNCFRQFPLVLVGALVFVTGILSAQDVRYNFMPGTDFSKFHTYKWITIERWRTPQSDC